MTIETVLRSHMDRYPAMRIQDIYKLLHQSAMGSEHAIASVEDARQWMMQELANMGVGPDEPVIDPISDDGFIVRVHLRPYIRQGGDIEVLLNAFICTANEFRGDPQILKEHWKFVVKVEHFPVDQLDSFIKSMQTNNFPAVHHSQTYEQFYRPAYRVVLKELITG